MTTASARPRGRPPAPSSASARADAPTGYGLFGRAGNDGYVQRLAVHPEAQGDGLGRALLADGLRWLQRRGAVHAYVNTQSDNDRAYGLYCASGFTPMPIGLCVLGRAL